MSGGRRKKAPNLTTAARALTSDALGALAEIVRSGASEHARIAAATAILDRGHGKPGQAVKVSGDGEGEPMKVRWADSSSEATTDPCQKPHPKS